jgi:hypothetical protein
MQEKIREGRTAAIHHQFNLELETDAPSVSISVQVQAAE